MIGDWRVRHLPRCTHHVFLSHCAEDRQRLVKPVCTALVNARYSPWLDQHHYPAGQGAFEALREGILKCRHVVYFVAAPFLSQGRGWNSVENAYANLLQENLHFSSLEVCHIQFPLFFVPNPHVVLQRSAWGPMLNRGRRRIMGADPPSIPG
jgi:TIR domain